MIRHLFVLKFAALALFATIWLVPQQSDAQVMLEVNGKVGATSATISDISYGDPIFDIGGGVQAAAMIRFVGGIAAGLNFNIQYDGHRMTGNPRGDSMSFFVPSVGVTARYELMPMVNVGAWLNYCFGSASVAKGNQEASWAVQGFEGGASLALNYQMKPYKTFVILGLYAYFEYLQLFLDENNLSEKTNYTDMNAPNNIGIGALLGVRFDLTL
ncbi:MAG: hypothetical protein RBU37_25665 [Myxococcota bacterium]|jgi:hypothetical protein|nr:hypothetical protein [Myxococcota bacterium]